MIQYNSFLSNVTRNIVSSFIVTNLFDKIETIQKKIYLSLEFWNGKMARMLYTSAFIKKDVETVTLSVWVTW